MTTKKDFEQKIPVGVKNALDNYFKYRDVPNKGSFIYAVLTNNLQRAAFLADVQSMESIKDIVYYLWNFFPKDAWGSIEAVEKYCVK